LNEAELLQAKGLIGLAPEQEITLKAVNQFFKNRAGSELSPEEEDRMSRLITFLRSEGVQLTIAQDGERLPCTWTSYFRKDRGQQLIVIRETGGERRCFWRRPSLPAGLHLQRD